MNAEVVVTFAAKTELGITFVTRQSYLAQEIHWGGEGGQFAEIISLKPSPGIAVPKCIVQLDRYEGLLCDAAWMVPDC